jgi:3,4-dihydroxy 2-butanone 4-phosphate synthase / GTP cyclohydrolase II
MAETATQTFSSIDDAIAAIARGEIVIVVDDPGRENEGDLVMAADAVTPDAINFMVTHGRGLVCMPMTGERLDALGLRQMVSAPTDPKGTAFTISIDMAEPRNTGISAYDRARTIARAADPSSRATEFTTPGHIFPLRAAVGGVLARPGHTEAAVDLATLAGKRPAGVVCEILNADGTMARMPELIEVARAHGLHLITIADLIAYRSRLESAKALRRVAEAHLPTPYGVFDAVGFMSDADGREHMALSYGDPGPGALARMHSECLTGDVFGSLRCDCGAQLDEAMRLIASEGSGVIVYVRGHEGRGIGLLHKLQAYQLQEEGADTVEANLALGLPVDARDYAVGAHMLRALGVTSVRLLTNNPAKVAGLETNGIAVAERIALETAPTAENLRYLQTKRSKMQHELTSIDLDHTLLAQFELA